MELIPFNYGEMRIRVVQIDGEPWFVASDIAKVLGYREAKDLTRRLDDDDKGRRSVPTPGGAQEMTVISEPGLYVAVLGSQVDGAKLFKRWVTHEVIPSIRKTGTYGGSVELTGPELIAKALIESQRIVEQHEARIGQLEQKVADDAPKVDYVDHFVADDDLLTVRTVSANLGVQETWLRDLLTRKQWIYCEESSRWSGREQRKVVMRRYSAYADKKRYFQPKPVHDAPRFRGEVMHTLKVTPLGAEAIAKLVAKELAA